MPAHANTNKRHWCYIYISAAIWIDLNYFDMSYNYVQQGSAPCVSQMSLHRVTVPPPWAPYRSFQSKLQEWRGAYSGQLMCSVSLPRVTALTTIAILSSAAQGTDAKPSPQRLIFLSCLSSFCLSPAILWLSYLIFHPSFALFVSCYTVTQLSNFPSK